MYVGVDLNHTNVSLSRIILPKAESLKEELIQRPKVLFLPKCLHQTTSDAFKLNKIKSVSWRT